MRMSAHQFALQRKLKIQDKLACRSQSVILSGIVIKSTKKTSYSGVIIPCIFFFPFHCPRAYHVTCPASNCLHANIDLHILARKYRLKDWSLFCYYLWPGEGGVGAEDFWEGS